MTPKLKPPRTKRLRVMCDVLLSTVAFNLNLRRYTTGTWSPLPVADGVAPAPRSGRAWRIMLATSTSIL